MIDTCVQRPPTAPDPAVGASQTKQERSVTALLDEIGDCVAVLDPDGAIRSINENGRCALTADELAMLDGGSWLDLWPAAMQGPLREAFDQAERGGIARLDAFRLDASGTPCWNTLAIGADRADDDRLDGYLVLYRAMTNEEVARRAAETATDEMRHRLKNSYAMVASLLTGFARGTPDREAFAEEMVGRLAALGAAQTAADTSGDGSHRLAPLVARLMQPFDRPACPIETRSLPATPVSRRVAETLSLVLGELATNSCKHGALAGRGAITIEAGEQRDGADDLSLRWSERIGGAMPVRPRGDGQGLRLLQRIMRLGRGEMTVTWSADGLNVLLRFGRS